MASKAARKQGRVWKPLLNDSGLTEDEYSLFVKLKERITLPELRKLDTGDQSMKDDGVDAMIDPFFSHLDNEERRKYLNIVAKVMTKSKKKKHRYELIYDEERTSVHQAALTGDTAGLAQLLKDGAEFMTKDNDGYTALHLAADERVAAMLLEAGAEPTTCSEKNGNTPLHEAARKQNVPLMKLLIHAGACKSTKNHEGQTAEDIERSCSSKRSSMLFLPTATTQNIGPKLNAPDVDHANDALQSWKYRCPKCYKVFQVKKSLENHVKSSCYRHGRLG